MRPSAASLRRWCRAGPQGSGRSLMVALEGRARVLTGDEARAVNHRLRAKYLVDDAIDAVDRAWDQIDDVAIEITPARRRSWVGAALHERVEQFSASLERWVAGGDERHEAGAVLGAGALEGRRDA